MREECLRLLKIFEKKIFNVDTNEIELRITLSQIVDTFGFINYDYFYNFHQLLSKYIDFEKINSNISNEDYTQKIIYRNKINILIKNKMNQVRISLRKRKLFLIKNNKEHDFCGYVCRFLIKDYTKFKNDLLLYLLKEI